MKQEMNACREERNEISVWMSIVAYMLLFFIFIVVFSEVIVLLFNFSERGVDTYGFWQLMLMQVVTFLSAFIPAFFLLRFVNHRPFSDLGFDLKGRGKELLCGLLVAMALYGIGFGLSLWLGVVEVIGIQFDPIQLLGRFFFFMLVAVTEEMMVRGYVLGQLLQTRLNKFVALFLSSVLFACMHLLNPNIAFLPVLNLVLAGMLLGAAYLYTRNLWFPISLHLFWNWIQGPVLGYEVSGNRMGTSLLKLHLSDNTLLNGGAFGFEGSLICTVLMVVFTGLIIGWFERENSHLPHGRR